MDVTAVAGLILLIGIVVGIALGVPIAVVIGVTSFIAIFVLLGNDPTTTTMNTASEVFTGINSFTLIAIPLFILAGGLMNQGGIAGRLVDAARVVVGKLPGGLAHTNVVSNSMFGAVSGAAVASAAAVGSVMGPRLEKEGYSKPWSAAVNVASAPAGMLIPPSNTFIVYSLVSSTSIAALFMAGVGPGIIWAIAVMLVVALTHKRFRTGSNSAAAIHPHPGARAEDPVAGDPLAADDRDRHRRHPLGLLHRDRVRGDRRDVLPDPGSDLPHPEGDGPAEDPGRGGPHHLDRDAAGRRVLGAVLRDGLRPDPGPDRRAHPRRSPRTRRSS